MDKSTKRMLTMEEIRKDNGRGLVNDWLEKTLEFQRDTIERSVAFMETITTQEMKDAGELPMTAYKAVVVATNAAQKLLGERITRSLKLNVETEGVADEK